MVQAETVGLGMSAGDLRVFGRMLQGAQESSERGRRALAGLSMGNFIAELQGFFM